MAVPDAEVEAAADALRILWNSEENKRNLEETGFGASYAYQAKVAIEAALMVRNRIVSASPRSTQ